MRKRKYSARQLDIIGFIQKRKEAGADVVTLDEIVDLCQTKGHLKYVEHESIRRTVASAMKILINRMSLEGVKITAPKSRGRGHKTSYRF